MCTAYLNFNRQRTAALAVGPSDEAVAAALEQLKGCDDTVADTVGWLPDYTQLNRLLGAALRGGAAEAEAYVAELRRCVDAALTPQAIAQARQELERSWNEADELMAERELH